MKEISSYIIYFGHFELPDKNALAHRVLANIKALEHGGYKAILVGYSRNIQKTRILKTHRAEEFYDRYEIMYPRTPLDWILDGRSHKAIKKVLETHDPRNCKAIIFTGVGVANTKGLLKISRKYNIPLISDTVDWFPYDESKTLYNRYKKWAENYINQKLKPRVKNIICISSYLSNYYLKKGCNVITIPSLTYYDDVRFSALDKYEPTKKMKICYVGNPGIKGAKDRVDWCVKAFIKAADDSAELKVIGISEARFKAEFPDVYCEIGNKRVFFEEKLSNKECVKEIATSDYFAFAREDTQITRAGFPTKFAESMAIGTPVITTPSGDLAMYISDEKNGFLSSKCTYDSYERAMKKALETTIEKRVSMHLACNESPLDEKNWREAFVKFVDNVVL